MAGHRLIEYAGNPGQLLESNATVLWLSFHRTHEPARLYGRHRGRSFTQHVFSGVTDNQVGYAGSANCSDKNQDLVLAHNTIFTFGINVHCLVDTISCIDQAAFIDATTWFVQIRQNNVDTVATFVYTAIPASL